MSERTGHTFHIPVLGVGYSVDAPVKVARYGISSVISLVDDTLMEKLRKHYLGKQNKEYIPITDGDADPRARRVTAYLNMINEMVKEQFEALKKTAFVKGTEITKYFEMLPDSSKLKKKYLEMLNAKDSNIVQRLQNWLRDNMQLGSIDVNIMTKLDRPHFAKDGSQLPAEYNDAHSALRGYASSDLESSIVFSAGMNPKLYTYLESFADFFPREDGSFKKKIIMKVSDYRSALIQGKFLAKKGLWVSEYRIESGLNCGGHAFASDGYLLGPILEEFKVKKDELYSSVSEIYLQALKQKNINITFKPDIDITVQGGVGTSSEHEFLLRHFEVKSVGWGSPFLLAPDVMNVDEGTLNTICGAKEEDYYLSDVSPLGVRFNNLRGNTKDMEKQERADKMKPGSPCPKKFLASNKEYSDKLLCTASITYLTKKVKELKEKYGDTEEFEQEYKKVTDKVCLCEGLSASTFIVNEIETPKLSRAVSICPGPNLAYFTKRTNLGEMVSHIYGKTNLVTHANRPNMFVKELSLYYDYFIEKITELIKNLTAQNETFLKNFRSNMLSGIAYYKTMISAIDEETEETKRKMLEALESYERKLLALHIAEAA
ncbi:MAG TPA: hypothetical protein VHO28_04020 [Ignavibacteriales bacterium]|nr:hypothetical protein [Ignavibacteriales bacterium]